VKVNQKIKDQNQKIQFSIEIISAPVGARATGKISKCAEIYKESDYVGFEIFRGGPEVPRRKNSKSGLENPFGTGPVLFTSPDSCGSENIFGLFRNAFIAEKIGFTSLSCASFFNQSANDHKKSFDFHIETMIFKMFRSLAF
jgi:hypothetical protein